MLGATRCPCGTGLSYDECCARFHAGDAAPTAEALMRSRFSAFALGDAAYLLSTWHPSTRPHALELDAGVRWYRLDILDRGAGGPLDAAGWVDFEAFYRGDSAGTQREVSTFVREAGRWFYVGESKPTSTITG
jgi:SEC-C motif domain protein